MKTYRNPTPHTRLCLGLLASLWALLAACSADGMPSATPGPKATSIAPTKELRDCAVEAGQLCSLPACGCPTEQTCAPDPDAPKLTLRCQPHNRLLGERCRKDQQCAPGLFCSEAGLCVELCETDADCGQDASGVCTGLRWRGQAVRARGCALACDPISPQSPSGQAVACPLGFGCDLVRPDVLDCREHLASAEPGAACSAPEDCTPGFTCDAGVCARYCASDDDCSAADSNARCAPLTSENREDRDVRVCTTDDASTKRTGPDPDPDREQAGDSDPDGDSEPDASECTPGDTGCDGVTPRTCNDDGEWENEAVAAGRCGAECEPGEVDCQGTTQRSCGSTGSWEDTAVEEGQCGAECNPGQEECDGNSLKQCTESGTWQRQEVEGGVCDAACTPGEEGCRGAVLWTCNSLGKWGGARVQEGSCGAVCSPGEPDCNGVTSFRCGLIGQWLPGEIVDGLCGAICTPGDFTCDGTVRRTCNGGLAWVNPTISTDCGADCNPGAEICDGNRQRTCDRNGRWDAGFVSSACGGECTPGQMACSLADDSFPCGPSPDSNCYVYSPNAGDVTFSTCDANGQWNTGTCDGVCNGGDVGLVHFCLVNGSRSGCYVDGVCPN